MRSFDCDCAFRRTCSCATPTAALLCRSYRQPARDSTRNIQVQCKGMAMMGRPADGEGGPARGGLGELLRLAWPLIVGNSLLALQILIDRILLGRTGGHQVGAALATALVFWTVMSLF